MSIFINHTELSEDERAELSYLEAPRITEEILVDFENTWAIKLPPWLVQELNEQDGGYIKDELIDEDINFDELFYRNHPSRKSLTSIVSLEEC